MTTVRIIGCATALVATAAAAPGQDLAGAGVRLENPGFEEVGEDGHAVGWDHGGAASIVTDAKLAHTGERAARVRFDDRYMQRIEVEGGQSYRITGWVRRVDPEGKDVPKIKVYFLDAEGGRADVQASEFTDVRADDYVPFDVMLRAPLVSVIMNLTLCGMYQGDQWFYYDDLSVEHVEAPDWPPWDRTPDLNGVTVTVPDVADVWTDALLRIPPRSLVPIDGLLDTAVESQGKDLVIELDKPYEINYLLVHAMQPMRNLGEAQIVSLAPESDRALVETAPQQELVTSEQFGGVEVSKFRLDIPDDARVQFSEVQVLRLAEVLAQLPARPVTAGLAAGEAPEQMRQHLEPAYPNEEHRAACVASPEQTGPPPEEMALPGMRYANVLVAPAETAYGVAALTLSLALSSDDPDNMLEICLKQADELDLDIAHATAHDRGPEVFARASADIQHPRQYADIFRVITRVGAGQKAVSVTFDIPDTPFAAGEPLWLTLRPKKDMTLKPVQSRVTAHLLTPEQTYPEYVPRLERLLRRMYSHASEAHAYDGRGYKHMYLGRYIARVLELDPDNEPATLIWKRVAHRKANVELTRPGPAEAPDWAVWARLALQNRHDIITWWLDNRQQGDGQLAGHINDDGEFSCNWPSHYLMTGDERIKEGLRLLADVAWRMSGGRGYTVGSRDVEHAAEDQSCTQPQMTIVDYGNPMHLERMMVMSQYLDFWTAINEVGRRQFKSYMFTADQVWDEPPNDVDHAYCPLAMVGAGHLVWYARIPDLSRIFLEEADSWAAATMSTDKGKPAGRIPGEIKFSNSEILPYFPYTSDNPILKNRNSLYMGSAGQYIVRYLLQGAYYLTGDEKFWQPLHVSDPTEEEIVRRAEGTRSLFNEEIIPPPDEPEKRFTVPGNKPAAIEEPLKPVRDGEAVGSGADEPVGGTATYIVNVPEAGRYGVWALLGRSDPGEPGEMPKTFFVTVNGGPDDRLRIHAEAQEWTPVTSQRYYELPAGEHALVIRGRTAGSAIKEIGFTSHYSLDGTWSPSQSETQLYEAWKVTGDKTWLVEELKECVRQQERHRWLVTEAEPYTDRVPVPGRTLLANLYLGGWTSGKSHVPGHWVSWEGGGTDYAALVLEAERDHLKALVYSFADGPRQMKMRLWRLPHGLYQVSVGADDDGDDQPDETLSEGKQELARYDAVEFAAPPGRTVVLDLRLLEELDDIGTRADLAIRLEDLSYAEGAVTVVVHNVGASAAPPTTVRLQDAAGKVLGEADVPALEAPLGLRPSTAEVTVKLSTTRSAAWRVVVDPSDAVTEITEVNNVLSMLLTPQ